MSEAPPDFDATAIGWVGDKATGISEDASLSGLWVGNLAAVGLRQLTTEVVVPVHVLPDGRILYRTDLFRPDGTTSVSVIDSSGANAPRHLATMTERLGIAPLLPGIVVTDVDRRGNDRGVWLVPLDGHDATQVLPPVDDMDQSLGHLAVSGDGSFVAREVPHPERGLINLQVGWSSDLIALPGGSRPIGFDAAGCLIVLRYPGRDLIRIDLSTRDEQVLVSGFVAVAEVKPDGRWLIALTGSQDGLIAVDLAGGRVAQVPLDGKYWSLTGLGGDRYVVLERSSVDDGGDDRGMIHAVLDLEDAWLTYLLPWLDR